MSPVEHKTYRQVPGLAMTDVPDGVVVADAEGAALHVLNPTAADSAHPL